MSWVQAEDLFLGFFREYGARVVLILALFVFGKVLLKRIVHGFVCAARARESGSPDFIRRMETLCGVASVVGKVMIYSVAILMTLKLFEVDIGPILAGAGVIGLAVGFGSQALVKDIVSGVFILIEDQYGIGDTVKIGAAEGRVLKITVRSTVLRNDEGHIFYISNGSINNVVNLSRRSL